MQREDKSFLIDCSGKVIDSRGLSKEIIGKVMDQIRKKYSNFTDFSLRNEGPLFVYNNIDNKEIMWYVKKDNNYIRFDNFEMDTMSKKNMTILLEQIHQSTTLDYKKIIMRKYSHDLSNLLTIILINLGYLEDEIKVGSITTSNNETVNQVINSALSTSVRIKKIIENNRNQNKWLPDQVEGTSLLKETIFKAFEIIRYHINYDLLFICDFPDDREIKMKDIYFIRCIQTILINAIEERTQDGLTIIDMQIEKDEKYNRFIISDNGQSFTENESDKFNVANYSNKENQLGLALTNIEKLVSLVGGKITFERLDLTKISLWLPK